MSPWLSQEPELSTLSTRVLALKLRLEGPQVLPGGLMREQQALPKTPSLHPGQSLMTFQPRGGVKAVHAVRPWKPFSESPSSRRPACGCACGA